MTEKARVIASSSPLEAVVQNEFPRYQYIVHEREIAVPEAKFALECIAKWAMIAADADGEDSGGRQKLRRLSAEEIVDHAFTVANLAYTRMKENGLLLNVPSFEEISELGNDLPDTN